jgi:hypothetical protein
MRRRAKKNHRIILWEVLSGIGSPIKNYLTLSRAVAFLFQGPGHPYKKLLIFALET